MDRVEAIIKKHSDFENTTRTGVLDEDNIKDICKELEENQNDLWKEANRLYNLKEHTQDGRDLQMKNFIIIRRDV